VLLVGAARLDAASELPGCIKIARQAQRVHQQRPDRRALETTPLGLSEVPRGPAIVARDQGTQAPRVFGERDRVARRARVSASSAADGTTLA
jgi:hypothetical protein